MCLKDTWYYIYYLFIVPHFMLLADLCVSAGFPTDLATISCKSATLLFTFPTLKFYYFSDFSTALTSNVTIIWCSYFSLVFSPFML